MKYEAPEVTTLTAAINAIQGTDVLLKDLGPVDCFLEDAPISAYIDWEEQVSLLENPKLGRSDPPK